MLQFIVKWAIIIVGVGMIGTVMHDDRVQDPYRSILAFGVFIIMGIVFWYMHTFYGWWQ